VRAVCFFLLVPLFGESPLDREIARIAAGSGGTVGVAALDLKSGRSVGLRTSERFPMASVFKLPVALTLLDRKTETPLSLKIKLAAPDARPFRSPIAQLASRGAMFTVEELLDAMLIESDNTAADVLLGICGGGAGVTAHLRALGIDEIRVDRSEAQMALDYAGVTDALPPNQWTLDWFNRAMTAVPRDQQRAAAERALADERDTATPAAMVKLLQLLAKGKALSQDRTELVLDRMRRAVPAAGRIKAGLPQGTVVAHRPGSGGENEGVTLCTNDVGIVELPGGRRMLVAIFLKGSNQNEASRERTIADITGAIFDSWTH
jgi:beta-lactamase class A